MAKPRVFISSTYYDLKYVRERLERFIRSYNCDPILFESDKVYFQPNQPLDKSCYDEVKTCHLMILIIGGRYGSTATEQEKEQYENNIISITQKEFETAIQMGIPVMTFIDMKVYADYETFVNNSNTLPKDFVFAHVDDVRIFSFISRVKQSALKTFNKIEDIEQYFSNQLSGMLYDYLISLQQKKENEDIQQSINKLNTVSDNMQNMLNIIGEKILGGNEKEKYKKLLLEQKQSSIDLFIDMIRSGIMIKKADDYVTNQADSYANILSTEFINTIFTRQFIGEYLQHNGLVKRWKFLNEKEEDLVRKVQGAIPGITIKFYFGRYIDHLDKILGTIGEEQKLQKYFQDHLCEMFYKELTMPF